MAASETNPQINHLASLLNSPNAVALGHGVAPAGGVAVFPVEINKRKSLHKAPSLKLLMKSNNQVEFLQSTG